MRALEGGLREDKQIRLVINLSHLASYLPTLKFQLNT